MYKQKLPENVCYFMHIEGMNMHSLGIQTKTQREAWSVVDSAPFLPAVKLVLPK